MANLTGQESARYVQDMFERLAARYDLMNRIMTLGQDARWRRTVIRLADLPPGGRLLDLGAGTGDLARLAVQNNPVSQVVAADFTLEMMRVGRRHTPDPLSERLAWVGADASRLPFPTGYFNAVVSGFLLRNVADLDMCLAEQRRVLKPGGRFVALDTTPPPATPLLPFLRFHLHTVIPTLGALIAGQAEAYHYLPDTTEGFLAPEELADRLAASGFVQVRFERRMFGTIAIHSARKPER